MARLEVPWHATLPTQPVRKNSKCPFCPWAGGKEVDVQGRLAGDENGLRLLRASQDYAEDLACSFASGQGVTKGPGYSDWSGGGCIPSSPFGLAHAQSQTC